MRLLNKVAIVTGGASGFGEGVVRKFVDEGARVLIADINLDLAQKVANDFNGEVIPLKVDVSNSGDINNMVKNVFIFPNINSYHK